MTNNQFKITFTREELYNLVWSEPFTKLSKRFETSDVGFRKFCERSGIPVPKAGHWSQSEARRNQDKPALDVSSRQADEKVSMATKPPASDYQVQIPKSSTVLHPVVLSLKESLYVSKKLSKRACRILHALVVSLEQQGWRVSYNSERQRLSAAKEQVDFTIELTETRKAESKGQGSVFSGRLSLKLWGFMSRSLQSSWTDGKKQRLENCLNQVIDTLERAQVIKQAESLKRQENARERRRARVVEDKLKRRTERLEQELENWTKAKLLLEYSEYLETSEKKSRNSSLWLKWIRGQAQELYSD